MTARNNINVSQHTTTAFQTLPAPKGRHYNICLERFSHYEVSIIDLHKSYKSMPSPTIHFVGRDEQLKQLQQYFQPRKTVPATTAHKLGIPWAQSYPSFEPEYGLSTYTKTNECCVLHNTRGSLTSPPESAHITGDVSSPEGRTDQCLQYHDYPLSMSPWPSGAARRAHRHPELCARVQGLH